MNLNPDGIAEPLANVYVSVLSSISVGYQEKDSSNVKLITRGSDDYYCGLGYKKHYSALRTRAIRIINICQIFLAKQAK